MQAHLTHLDICAAQFEERKRLHKLLLEKLEAYEVRVFVFSSHQSHVTTTVSHSAVICVRLHRP